MTTKRKMVTEKRWASLDRYHNLDIFDRGVLKRDAAYEVGVNNVRYSADAPHNLVRVTLSYPVPPKEGR